jgi:hypothetical protein
MLNPWTMKMEQFTRFTPEKLSRLDQLLQKRPVRPCGGNVR